MEVLPTANFQPDIVVYGLRLGEPMIAFTGLWVTLLCGYAWWRLRQFPTQEDALRLASIFFLLMAISTLIGAFVGHLFIYRLPFLFKLPGWLLGMVAVSALTQASIERSKPSLSMGWSRGLTRLNYIFLALAFCFVTVTCWFPGVEIHSAGAMLGIILPLEARKYAQTKQASSAYHLLGIFFLLTAAAIHVFKWALGIWFSYFDVAHIFMCLAFGSYMLGAEAHARFTETKKDVVTN